VAGYFPGLEYSAALRVDAYDMSKDFDPVRRGFATLPLAAVKPVVDASQPLIEGLLLQSGGKKAVTLMNWAYKHAGKKSTTVAFKDVTVDLRGAGEVKRVVSTALDRELKVERTAEGFRILVPLIEEGDVLRLE
jgi:hypothetical protein